MGGTPSTVGRPLPRTESAEFFCRDCIFLPEDFQVIFTSKPRQAARDKINEGVKRRPYVVDRAWVCTPHDARRHKVGRAIVLIHTGVTSALVSLDCIFHVHPSRRHRGHKTLRLEIS